MAELTLDPPPRPVTDGIVPEEIVARTEKRWVTTMAVMLVVMLAIMVVTGVAGALHPSSNVEVIDSRTCTSAASSSKAISARRSSPTSPRRCA